MDGDYVRVIIGSFVGHIPRPVGPHFSWITDHACTHSVIDTIEPDYTRPKGERRRR